MQWTKTNDPIETNQVEELRAELDANPGQWYEVTDWPVNSYQTDLDQAILMATEFPADSYRILGDCIMRIPTPGATTTHATP